MSETIQAKDLLKGMAKPTHFRWNEFNWRAIERWAEEDISLNTYTKGMKITVVRIGAVKHALVGLELVGETSTTASSRRFTHRIWNEDTSACLMECFPLDADSLADIQTQIHAGNSRMIGVILANSVVKHPGVRAQGATRASKATDAVSQQPVIDNLAAIQHPNRRLFDLSADAEGPILRTISPLTDSYSLTTIADGDTFSNEIRVTTGETWEPTALYQEDVALWDSWLESL